MAVMLIVSFIHHSSPSPNRRSKPEDNKNEQSRVMCESTSVSSHITTTSPRDQITHNTSMILHNPWPLPPQTSVTSLVCALPPTLSDLSSQGRRSRVQWVEKRQGWTCLLHFGFISTFFLLACVIMLSSARPDRDTI